MQSLAQSRQVVFQVRVQRLEGSFFVLDLLQDLARQGLVQEPIPYLHELHERRVKAHSGWFSKPPAVRKNGEHLAVEGSDFFSRLTVVIVLQFVVGLAVALTDLLFAHGSFNASKLCGPGGTGCNR